MELNAVRLVDRFEQRLEQRMGMRKGAKHSKEHLEWLQSLRSMAGNAKENIDAIVDAFADRLDASDAEAEQGRALQAQLGERSLPHLLAEAEAGRAYRGQLEDRARTARIAVEGQSFTGNAEDVAAYSELLGQFSVRMLEAEARRWEGTRAAVFTPGRQVPPSDPNARVAESGEFQVVRR